MLATKKFVERIDSWIRKEFNEDLKAIKEVLGQKIDKGKYIECSTCGCLVNRGKAKKVQSLVDNNDTLNMLMRGMVFLRGDEVDSEADKKIKTDYYCIHCQKNNKKKKK